MVKKQKKNTGSASQVLYAVGQLFRGYKTKAATPWGDSRFGDYFKPTFFLVVFDLMKRALPLLPTIFQWIEITNIYTYTCLGEGHLSSSLKTSPIRLKINNL